jgi:oligo-1,6-glucosidase
LLEAMRKVGRDNARTPMQWDASAHAGFTTGTPWIAVNPNYTEINAQAAREDSDSVFHHYRRLIELRHTEPAVAHGDFTMHMPDDERVYAFTRALDGVELLVLGNFSGAAAPVPEAVEWADAELLVGNCAAPGTPAEHATLKPWEARVYRRERLSPRGRAMRTRAPSRSGFRNPSAP